MAYEFTFTIFSLPPPHQHPLHKLRPIMRLKDNLLFLFRTPNQNLDLRIPFQQIHNTHHPADPFPLIRPHPDVDSASVHGRSVFQVTIIHLINKIRELWV